MKTEDVSRYFLKKMCQFAEVDYNSVDFDDSWNGGKTWTRDQRQQFLIWLSEYLKSHKAIRKLIMKEPNKKNIPKFVASWVAAYGFKIK